MDIVVLSGKGGTGKTTVATNLSVVMDYSYIDCDVEEPNGYIFLKPQALKEEEVFLLNPVFNAACTKCGKCVKACEYNAIVTVLDKIMLFEELCHGCGTCKLVCPMDAITEVERVIGHISYNDTFAMGLLKIKEPMGGPIISAVKRIKRKNRIIDAPPGTSCSVVKSVEDADYAVLVTEPTTFGLHDLKKAVELVVQMEIPFGVIINRYEVVSLMDHYLKTENIEIIGKIPFSKEAAVLYSKGHMLIEAPSYLKVFEELADTVKRRLNESRSG